MKRVGHAPPVPPVPPIGASGHHALAADVILIRGPEMDPVVFVKIQEACRKARLDLQVVGDGVQPIEQSTVEQLHRNGRLGSSSHILVSGHGGIMRKDQDPRSPLVTATKGENATHRTLGNLRGLGSWRTIDLIAALRTRPKDMPDLGEHEPYSGMIHLFTCQAGFLKTELTPRHPIWNEASCLVHTSTKRSITDSTMANVIAVIDLLGEFKKNKLGTPDPMRVFQTVKMVTGECITLLGGALDQAKTAHAPKNGDDVRKDHLEAVRWLDERGIDFGKECTPAEPENDGQAEPIDSYRNKLQNTFFVRSSRRNKGEAVSSLIARYPNLVNATTPDGSTSLHAACYRGDGTLIEELLRHKADINALNSAGRTPLHMACGWMRPVITALLVQAGALVDARGKSGVTPLMVACAKGDVESAGLLLGAGADASLYNDAKRTPLLLAAEKGNEKCVELLLSWKDVDPNCCDTIGNASLHYACLQGHASLASLLLRSSRVNINLRTPEGDTPLSLACAKNRHDMVSLMVSYGAYVDLPDNLGRTPLMRAALAVNADRAAKTATAKALFAANADLDAQDIDGCTALMHACWGNDLRTVSTLLQAGASTRLRNLDGKTAFDLVQRRLDKDRVSSQSRDLKKIFELLISVSVNQDG